MNSRRVIEANKKAMELFGDAEVGGVAGVCRAALDRESGSFRQSMEVRFRGAGACRPRSRKDRWRRRGRTWIPTSSSTV
jgi:hypothetical protein